MGQLMLIAVSVEDGTSQSTVKDPKSGDIVLDPDKPLRVVGCLDSARFDRWVASEIELKQMQPPHVHGYPAGSSPTRVGQIFFSHNSPGQVCVDFNGVPICYP
jgi:hypothetical protein